VLGILLDSLKGAHLKFPMDFLGGVAEMRALFRAIAQSRSYPATDPGRMWKLLPEKIRILPCFLDEITGIWRYEYGEPITLGDSTVVGTHMFPDVETLYHVIGCASWRLGMDELDAYLKRLTDRGKHQDVLVEFAPILRLSSDVAVTSEVKVEGGGTGTVDWHIKAPGEPALLLEVKNRVDDIIKSFEAIKRRDPRDPIPEPEHDHRLLFRSVEKKFGARKSDESIHCVWLKTGLMQEEDELQKAFENLKPGYIHAVAIGSWDENAYVIAADGPTKKKVLRILKLRQSRGLTFKRKMAQQAPSA
jgi:hypothetical protein